MVAGSGGVPSVKIPRDVRAAFVRSGSGSGSARSGVDLLSPGSVSTPATSKVGTPTGSSQGGVVPLVVALAGSGSPGCSDGFATSATFDRPAHVALDPSNGDLYVTEYNNNSVRVRACRTTLVITAM